MGGEARRPRAAVVAVGLALAILPPGCVEREDPQAAARAAEAARELAAWLDAQPVAAPGELVVELAFGAEADLDLYVTDPLLESVYFANRQARSGGAIAADVRCDAPAPRLERVRFSAPPAGRYRVGVDHPARCDDAADPVGYALRVTGPGISKRSVGVVAEEAFELVALEFELPAAPGR